MSRRCSACERVDVLTIQRHPTQKTHNLCHCCRGYTVGELCWGFLRTPSWKCLPPSPLQGIFLSAQSYILYISKIRLRIHSWNTQKCLKLSKCLQNKHCNLHLLHLGLGFEVEQDADHFSLTSGPLPKSSPSNSLVHWHKVTTERRSIVVFHCSMEWETKIEEPQLKENHSIFAGCHRLPIFQVALQCNGHWQL